MRFKVKENGKVIAHREPTEGIETLALKEAMYVDGALDYLKVVRRNNHRKPELKVIDIDFYEGGFLLMFEDGHFVAIPEANVEYWTPKTKDVPVVDSNKHHKK